MFRHILLLVLIVGLLGTGCASSVASQTLITFFYVVNMSGRKVAVRVSADGQELFVQEIEAVRQAGPGGGEVPSPGPYPARQLKVPVSGAAKQLVVEELNSGQRAVYDQGPGVQSDAGFRIVIGPDDISITRDYVLIR